MLKTLANELKSAGFNVFRMAMFHDGGYFEEQLLPVSACCNCYSISKNFTATAIGIAQDMKLLSVEDSVRDYFSQQLPETYDPKLGQVKIKHLLRHTMGLEKGFLFEADRYNYHTDDWVSLALSPELKYAPGAFFAYSNSTYYLLSCIVEKVSGLPMHLFLQKYLFSPLSFNGYAWECCPKGHTMGATGLYLGTADLLKLGRLYLQNGIWEGQRLLSQEWIDSATSIQKGLPNEHYGYSFWLTDHAEYSGNGAYNQHLVIAPEKNTVVALHAFDESKGISERILAFIHTL